jgi:hypothetical protein
MRFSNNVTTKKLMMLTTEAARLYNKAPVPAAAPDVGQDGGRNERRRVISIIL